MDKPDEHDLLQVATAVSDGVAVDWAHFSMPQAPSQATAVLREMAVLDRIAQFHRKDIESATPTDVRRGNETQALEHEVWGHLRLLEKIGKGTFGVVYRARDTKLDSEVALKLLNSAFELPTEARNLARVRHHNVVTVYGTDQIDGRIGIWMEFVNGRTLGSLLKSNGPYGAREAAGIGVDLCRALAAVHAAGLMHGDVKAHNVMRAAGGRTVLMDFGTGKELETDAHASGSGGNDFAGTPLYVAPEVFEGHPRTKRSEIYSLGVLLYHLVTDAYPVEGKTRAELERAHRRGERKFLRDARPDLPDDFVYGVERALAVNPQERYASVGEFEAALARFGNVRPDPQPVPRPRPSWLVAAALVGAVGLTGAMYWLAGRSTTPATVTTAAPTSTGSVAAVEPAYQIDTALYRVRGKSEQRLRPGERVALGDGLFVKLRVSTPTYVYIVNEDDRGESYLLFPQPGQTITNPVPAGMTNRIPGTSSNAELDWQVSSVGGREHFLIFASPERVPALEDVFASLPRPELGRTPKPPRLPDEAIRRLRGVGGLTAKPSEGSTAKLAPIFSTPLGETEETARGLWVRKLTIDNPVAGR
ncbi:MAG TPA: serine/threonine-protein kinase [Vicinamibacterales bacterium]|nr:serine/threonine-protein kinase [Vicinamibacterales bacterium]